MSAGSGADIKRRLATGPNEGAILACGPHGFSLACGPAERGGAIACRCILETISPCLALVLKLIATLTSPYARKVRIALAEKKFEYTLVEDSPRVAGKRGGELNSAR